VAACNRYSKRLGPSQIGNSPGSECALPASLLWSPSGPISPAGHVFDERASLIQGLHKQPSRAARHDAPSGPVFGNDGPDRRMGTGCSHWPNSLATSLAARSHSCDRSQLARATAGRKSRATACRSTKSRYFVPPAIGCSVCLDRWSLAPPIATRSIPQPAERHLSCCVGSRDPISRIPGNGRLPSAICDRKGASCWQWTDGL
jgi:hypothetical protein